MSKIETENKFEIYCLDYPAKAKDPLFLINLRIYKIQQCIWKCYHYVLPLLQQ